MSTRTFVDLDNTDALGLDHLARQRGVTRAEIAGEIIHAGLDESRSLRIELDDADRARLDAWATATGTSSAELASGFVCRLLEQSRQIPTQASPGGDAS